MHTPIIAPKTTPYQLVAIGKNDTAQQALIPMIFEKLLAYGYAAKWQRHEKTGTTTCTVFCADHNDFGAISRQLKTEVKGMELF